MNWLRSPALTPWLQLVAGVLCCVLAELLFLQATHGGASWHH